METLGMHRRLALGASPAILLLWILAVTVSATKHDVGGKKGWAPDVNYTEWASHERFFVDEWLVFYYQKGMYDVVQVNATDFDRCSAENPITKWNRGHSYAFHLEKPGHYYFICSNGYCYHGMKLSIVAEEATPPAPAPELSPASSSGSFPFTQSLSLPVFFTIATTLAGIF
ncbi:hypothetical protein J5N97_015788 [Dioscorea zingiberensis]|uniref:Phytocyanin domain-containing protein n=1 Tax=Dioscorea zingiberensis TaxID=325984 RepID=A0A9D5CJS8_9LILI|nr:hypothetical protein J5N97_015788 [Dioscorea zingiberensis]